MDDFELVEASPLEHLLECACEFLFSDDPSDGASIGNFELAPRLFQQLEASLEDRQKVQLLGDSLGGNRTRRLAMRKQPLAVRLPRPAGV
jgi:hypothetical protein